MGGDDGADAAAGAPGMERKSPLFSNVAIFSMFTYDCVRESCDT